MFLFSTDTYAYSQKTTLLLKATPLHQLEQSKQNFVITLVTFENRIYALSIKWQINKPEIGSCMKHMQSFVIQIMIKRQ